MTSPKYSLARHVFLCFAGNHVVFLDLRRDKYLGLRLDSGQRRALCSLLRGWRQGDEGAKSRPLATERDVARVAQLLRKHELVTADSVNGKDASPVAIDPPTQLLLGHEYGAAPPARAADIARFLAATMLTVVRFRCQSIKGIVGAVEYRKAHDPRCGRDIDFSKARELVMLFNELRLFLPQRRVCLFDSLCLINFLSFYGIFPTLVFGVRMEPFYAHCWVQERGMLFNESLERVAGLTPIMAV